MKTTKDHPSSFRRSAALGVLALGLALSALASASAAQISGKTTASVVWISAPSAVPQSGDFTMVNHHKSFLPSLLVVPRGSSVRFPNEDPFYHSIYSDSKLDPFDIGYYDTGPGKVVPFARAGVVNVHCHIHVYMHATIVVVDGPYAQVGSDGQYHLLGVPRGTFVLHTWDARNGERDRTVRVPDANARLTLNL